MNKYLFWDFDGTLGGRIDGLYGRAWSASMLEAVNMMYPDYNIKIEDIGPFLMSGFPWHEPEKGHTFLKTPDLWWEHIMAIFKRIYLQLGFNRIDAQELSILARSRFLDLSTWELYEDTIPVLQALTEKGWKHYIVSNHVPELRDIITHLELNSMLEGVINSAEVGFEKPNPEIYKAAIQMVGTDRNLWMIGDNVLADVIGAERVGIQGILVRNRSERAKYQFDHLYELKDFLESIE